MDKKEHKDLVDKVVNVEKILQHILAVELYKLDVTQEQIAKHLKMSKGSVNNLLKGVKKEKGSE